MSESEENESVNPEETDDDLKLRNAVGIADDELEDPERAVELCHEDGILFYKYYAEAIARRLDEGGLDERALRLRLLARSIRIDAPVLRNHPELVVQSVVDRLRWFTEEASDPLLDWEGDVEGLELGNLLERWRVYSRSTDGARVRSRRLPRDLPTERLSAVLSASSGWKRVAFGRGETRLYGVTVEGRVMAFNLPRFEQIWEQKVEGSPKALEYNLDLNCLVLVTEQKDSSGEQTAVIELFNLDHGHQVDQYEIRCVTQEGVTSVARDAPRAVVGGADYPYLVNLETGEHSRITEEPIFRADISPGGEFVVYTEYEGAIDVNALRYDGEDLNYEWGAAVVSQIYGISIGDGLLATSLENGIQVLWELETGEVLDEIHSPGGVVADLELSPNGDALAGAWLVPDRIEGYSTTIWHTETREVTHRLTGGVVRDSSVAFSPEGNRMAMAGEDGRLRVIDLDKEILGPRARVRSDNVCAVALDGSRNLAALATYYEDDPIQILDLEEMEIVDEMEFEAVPQCLAFSEEGGYLVAIPTHESTENWAKCKADIGTVQEAEAAGVEILDEIDFGRNDLEKQVEVDEGTGATSLPNPLEPTETLIWPEPLMVFEGLDQVYLSEGCRFVLAHQANRLEVLEVVDHE